MDRATRYGSYVPVTTIGIAPIFGPEAPRQHIHDKCTSVRYPGPLAVCYPDYGMVREVSEPPSTTGLHRRVWW